MFKIVYPVSRFNYVMIKFYRGDLKVPNLIVIKFYQEQVNFNNECLFSKRKILYGKLT